LIYSNDDLNQLKETIKGNSKVYHLRRNSYPTIVSQDPLYPNKLIFILNMAKPNNNKNNKSGKTNTEKNKQEASGIKEVKPLKAASDTQPKKGSDPKKALVASTDASGTKSQLINSAAQPSQDPDEHAVKQVVEQPVSQSESKTLLLPHEEDIIMQEEPELLLPKDDDIIMSEQDSLKDVEKYFDSLPIENPLLESETKNKYGGSGPIASYNQDNTGATGLLANNAMYQEMQKQLITQQEQIRILNQQLQLFMTSQKQSSKLNLLSTKHSRDDLEKIDMDLYNTQDKVENLNKQLIQVKNNTNNNLVKLHNNFEYNEKVLDDTQKAIEDEKKRINQQKNIIKDLNDKINLIAKNNAITLKGKQKEDELSLVKINQCYKDLEVLKAEMNLKFHIQNELVTQYDKVEESLKTITKQLNHYQNEIDNLQNQIELSDHELSKEKLLELSNSQIDFQKKFNDTITSLNNIKISNKDLETNFRKQVDTIRKNISKYDLSLSDETLQFEYKKLVEKHLKTTKFFEYKCFNNKILLFIKDPKYTNLVNKLIFKSYEDLWGKQSGLNEPTIDNLSYYSMVTSTDGSLLLMKRRKRLIQWIQKIIINLT